MAALEVWGGIECTFNRVGNQYMDQCKKNGHDSRPNDFQFFKKLEIKKLRYPCLWEKVSPEAPDKKNWKLLDEKLAELRLSGIEPIAGFLHHGSGPSYTNLLDPHFPALFADYAREFAQRYPWVENFTPINEIVTTARFSCLYGHWYPHQSSDYAFLSSVLLQCRATVLAMREIRKITPHAKLIQTDDIGKCQSTKILHYQRDFENERRWLAFDLLCGKVDSLHPLYKFIIKSGIKKSDLEWAQKNTCPPDIIGINHYLLSNRYLDHRVNMYPEHFRGGNGIHRYADVGVLDTGQAELPQPEMILEETWKRFSIPIAVTEVHTRGHREEQMRWLYQMWNAAKIARENGIDVKAVTSWSLLGTYDWNSLCTVDNMFYEPGVFDLRSGEIKTTGLARLVYDLATKGDAHSPLLETKGQWHSPRRILFAAHTGAYSPLFAEASPVLITGKNEAEIRMMAKICRSRNLAYKTCLQEEAKDFIEEFAPWAVVYIALDLNNSHDIFSRCHERNIPVACHLSELSGEECDKNQCLLFLHNLFEDIDQESHLELLHASLDLLVDHERGVFEYNAERNFWMKSHQKKLSQDEDQVFSLNYVSEILNQLKNPFIPLQPTGV